MRRGEYISRIQNGRGDGGTRTFRSRRNDEASCPAANILALKEFFDALDQLYPARSVPTNGPTITAVTFDLHYLLLNCRHQGAYLLVWQMRIP